METILTQYYQSPYGELLLGSFGDKLCLCDWMLNEKRRVTVDKRIRQALHADYEEGTSEVIARAIIQLDEYFACKRTIFDVPLPMGQMPSPYSSPAIVWWAATIR